MLSKKFTESLGQRVDVLYSNSVFLSRFCNFWSQSYRIHLTPTPMPIHSHSFLSIYDIVRFHPISPQKWHLHQTFFLSPAWWIPCTYHKCLGTEIHCSSCSIPAAGSGHEKMAGAGGLFTFGQCSSVLKSVLASREGRGKGKWVCLKVLTETSASTACQTSLNLCVQQRIVSITGIAHDFLVPAGAGNVRTLICQVVGPAPHDILFSCEGDWGECREGEDGSWELHICGGDQ